MAGEPESLSTHEPLAERIVRHDFDRLLMLSDGVFAIAITLLALELKLPEHWDGSLPGLIEGAGRPLLGYVFAFLLVGAFWIAHRRMFAKMVKVDRLVSLSNLLILGLIGLAPFVARLIAEKGPSKAIPVYLTLTGLIFIIYALIFVWSGKSGLLHPEIDRKQWRRECIGLVVGGGAILSGGIASLVLKSRPSPMGLMLIALAAALAARFSRRGVVVPAQTSSTSRP